VWNSGSGLAFIAWYHSYSVLRCTPFHPRLRLRRIHPLPGRGYIQEAKRFPYEKTPPGFVYGETTPLINAGGKGCATGSGTLPLRGSTDSSTPLRFARNDMVFVTYVILSGGRSPKPKDPFLGRRLPYGIIVGDGSPVPSLPRPGYAPWLPFRGHEPNTLSLSTRQTPSPHGRGGSP